LFFVHRFLNAVNFASETKRKLLVSIQMHSIVQMCVSVCVYRRVTVISMCVCVLCHLWAALVDFIWSYKICIACVFMAQQSRTESHRDTGYEYMCECGCS